MEYMGREIEPPVDEYELCVYLGEIAGSQQARDAFRALEAVIMLLIRYGSITLPEDPEENFTKWDWPPDIALGAKMLAARLYRRRNSPAGVESLGELGPVYVSRTDPDLAQLLRLGRYARPQVG